MTTQTKHEIRNWIHILRSSRVAERPQLVIGLMVLAVQECSKLRSDIRLPDTNLSTRLQHTV